MRNRPGLPARAWRLAVLGLTTVTLGAALPAPAPATASSRAPTASLVLDPTYNVWFTTGNKDFCLNFQVCVWDGTGYTKDAIFYRGNYGRCEGWRFENTWWQDHTYSIWNRASGPISIWNRHADGSFHYDKYGWLASDYSWGTTPFSYIMDAWVYDPFNDCRDGELFLHVVKPPGG